MLNISKYKIKPDFNLLLKTLSGKEKSGKVYSIELLIDEEIRKDIIENYFNERYSPPPFKIFRGTLKGIPAKELKEMLDNYYKQDINFNYKLGYTFIRDVKFFMDFHSLFYGAGFRKKTFWDG